MSTRASTIIPGATAALVATALLLNSFCPATANPFGPAFWDHWGDGQAELSSYELSYPRYGEIREGTAVAIFVTETFSRSLRVKADPGKHPKDDEFPVMKLNLVEDFATGIYDYNMMSSVFVALNEGAGLPAGSAAKVSFGSQEWCGHVYAHLLFDDDGTRLSSHSYFDGEADLEKTLDAREGGVSEDALMLWARGLAAPFLGDGQSIDRPLLGSLASSRLQHRPVAWTKARFARGVEQASVELPAGRFDTTLHTVELEGGKNWRFWVETAAPHRLVQWECSTGERAQLVASERMKYWQMNGNGREVALQRLGLVPRPPRTP